MMILGFYIGRNIANHRWFIFSIWFGSEGRNRTASRSWSDNCCWTWTNFEYNLERIYHSFFKVLHSDVLHSNVLHSSVSYKWKIQKSIVNILSNCDNLDLSILPEILRSQIYNLSEPNSIAINDRQNGWFWLAVKRVSSNVPSEMTRCELWILEFWILNFVLLYLACLNFISRYVCKKYVNM